MLGDLINYGSRPGEWRPGGGDHVPEGWVGYDTFDRNLDTDYLGMPDLTSFCTSCREIRPNEPLLSHVEIREFRVRVRLDVRAGVHVRLRVAGEGMRVCDALCQRCVRSDPPEDMS